MTPSPRLLLVHLSGPQEGERTALPRLPATIGSSDEADVVLAGTAPRHCLLFCRGSEVLVLDSGSGHGTYLAGAPVHEVALQEGDVLELGAGGPRLQVVRDEDGGRTRGRRLSDTVAFRIVSHTSRTFRRALLVVLGLMVAGAVWGWRESARMKREIVTLQQEVRRSETDRQRLEERVETERRRAQSTHRQVESTLEGFRGREEAIKERLAAAATGEVQALKQELETTRSRIRQLETERAAGETIIRKYGSGVCLIQGVYVFEGPSGGPPHGAVDPEESEAGATAAATEGGADEGLVEHVEYYGTGFLADSSGLILTNRHVAEPWWGDKNAEALQAAGFRARLISLRAFFPGHERPFPLELVRRADKVDLALLRAEGLAGRQIPVLPLSAGKDGAVPGQPVVVVGYPAGLEALLAKAETSLVKQILESHGPDSSRVTEDLSRRGLIRPSTTQGHIGDVTSSDIVFDAPTTQGGSGGPVFNKRGQVIAVEYAVLTRFGGNSFGIPAAFAVELLRGSAPGARAARARPPVD